MYWDSDKIKSVLPHREPFIFIDEVIEIEGIERVVAVKNIKADEGFFKGHFPGKPVMPGVLIIEAMAQASIILFALTKPHIAEAKPDYYLGKVRAEFLSPVCPGERLLLEATAVKITDTAGVVDVLALVENRIIAKSNLVFGIKNIE